MCVCCSVVSNSAIPWTVAHQAPLSMEFSREEYWSGLPFPSPGDFPGPGLKPGSLALQVHSLPSEPPGKPTGTSRLHEILSVNQKAFMLSAIWN